MRRSKANSAEMPRVFAARNTVTPPRGQREWTARGGSQVASGKPVSSSLFLFSPPEGLLRFFDVVKRELAGLDQACDDGLDTSAKHSHQIVDQAILRRTTRHGRLEN